MINKTWYQLIIMDYPPIAHGGKGRIAPYSTCHYRIPVPIKATVQRMAAAYRQCIEEEREPKALLQRVEQAIDPTALVETSNLEDKHTIAQLQEKIAKLEEQNEISAKLLNHARRDKQESLEETQRIINQKQAAIERLMKELEDAEQALVSYVPSKETDPALEKENLELHEKIGDLDLALQNAQGQIDSLKLHLKGLEKDWHETQLAQLKAATILKQALELKANAGGAIKAKIREVLPLVDDI